MDKEPMEEMKEFFKGLSTTLAEALGEDDEADKAGHKKPKDEETGMGKEAAAALKAVAEAIDLGNAESPLVKALDGIQADLTMFREVMEKTLERLEALEKGTAVKKSLDGQDGDKDALLEKAREKAEKDGTGQWGGVMKSLLTNGKVTLN